MLRPWAGGWGLGGGGPADLLFFAFSVAFPVCRMESEPLA